MIRFKFFPICILLISLFSFAEDKNKDPNNILYEFKGYSKKTSFYHSLKDFGQATLISTSLIRSLL
jgi:hypothetical protein